MHEPVEVALIEVLDRKGTPIPDLTLAHPVPEIPGKVSDPWFPEKVLLPTALGPAFKTLFPAEFKHEGTECVLTEAIGSRHVIAIYGPAPALRDAPPAAEEPTTTEEPAPVEEPQVEGPPAPPAAPVPVTLTPSAPVAPGPTEAELAAAIVADQQKG